MKNLLVITLISYISVAVCYSQCISPVIYPKIGANLDGTKNWSSIRYFTDFAKEGHFRDGPSNPGNPGNYYSGSLNTNGWPTTAFHLSLMEGGQLSSAYYGTYRLRYKGSPSAVSGSINVGGGYCEKDIVINNSNNFGIDFFQPVDEIQMIPTTINGVPTGYTFSNFPTFNANVYNTYTNFSAFRMMDWGHTNENLISSWSQRAKKTGVQTNENFRTGVAYEYMIEFCNVTGKDLWINIPINADDNFVQNLAQLIKNNLRPDKNVYVEWGNEIWNFGGQFWCYQALQLQVHHYVNATGGASSPIWGSAANGDITTGSIGTAPCTEWGRPSACGFNAWTLRARYIGIRLVQISNIFAGVFGAGEINNRVRVVMAGQFGYGGKGHGWNIDEGLRWINTYIGPPKNYLYATAGAPYVQLWSTNVNDINALFNTWNTGTDDMFLCHNCSAPEGNQMEGWLGKAREYGLKYLSYEGGPDPESWAPSQAKRDAKRDNRFKDLYIKYFNHWYAQGDDGLFNIFNAGYSQNYSSLYAWAETLNDNSPMRQAVNQVATTPNPTLTAGHTIPGIVDARKVYGWSECGEMYQCCFGARCTEDFVANMYNHPWENDAWLLSSNTNSSYTIRMRRNWYLPSVGKMYVDGSFIGNFTVPGTTEPTWQTITVSGQTNFPFHWGTHVMRFEYDTRMGDIYEFDFVQQAPLPPGAPSRPQGVANVCNSGDNGIQYFVPYDASVCQYQWSITGSNVQTVGVTNLNVLTVNYLNGFSGGTIRVRGVGPGPTYGNWSQPLSISGINCGFSANLLTPCLGQTVNFSENSGTGTTWRWDFGDVNATVTGATTATPTVKYSSFGLKTIVVYVNEGTTTPLTFYKYNYINVVNTCVTIPSSSFSSAQSTLCIGQNNTFNNLSSGAITATSWNFGVGASPATSSLTAPGIVSYSSSGVKSVSLTVSGPGGISASIITITVNTNFTPSITATASQNNICSGTTVTFTGVPTNGGATPAYQWYVNGTPQGTGSTSYAYTPSNNDQVRIRLTSNALCASPTTATSSIITMSVSGTVTPTASISTTTPTICAGQLTQFTSTISGGGATPTYQWQVNGANVGSNSNTYTTTGLTHGQTVRLILTSSSACASPTSATTSGITMTVNPNLTPTVSITASQANICSGTGITFVATPTNGGTPTYQWKLNGANTGTSSATYTGSSFAHNDMIRVVMTGVGACISSTPATSTGITLTINPNLTPSITATASQNNICSGTTVTFTGVPTNGGTAPTYQWYVNGSPQGTGSTSYAYTPSNNDQVRVRLTSNAL
ncbi:MAG: hypothetical protein NW207_03695, partial [Cytophagales bacterium]|nr:hypothetical protein [Cytophagales bacterium]